MKLRIPDKIAAAKELVRVCEWAKPDRVELSATDTLGDFINSIRKRRRGRDSTSWITRKTTGSDAAASSHALRRPRRRCSCPGGRPRGFALAGPLIPPYGIVRPPTQVEGRLERKPGH